MVQPLLHFDLDVGLVDEGRQLVVLGALEVGDEAVVEAEGILLVEGVVRLVDAAGLGDELLAFDHLVAPVLDHLQVILVSLFEVQELLDDALVLLCHLKAKTGSLLFNFRKHFSIA